MSVQWSTAGQRKLPSTRQMEVRALRNILPELQDAKYQRTYDEKRLGLEEKALNEAEKRNIFDADMAEKTYDANKKRDKISNTINAASLLTNAYGSYKKNEAYNQVFGETGKTVDKTPMPLGTSVTQTDPDIAPTDWLSTGALSRAGAGALLGYAGKSWLEKAGMDESTADWVAPVAGATAAYVAPAVYQYAAPIVKSIWSGVSEWFGGLFG